MTKSQKIVGVLALAVCAVVGTKLQLNQTLEYDLSDQSLAYLNAYMTSEKKGSGSSNSEKGSSTNPNAEKSSLLKDLNDWWNRKDWVCADAICEHYLYRYESNVPARVEDGKGTVAHDWNCTGCGGYGYYIIKK